MNAWTTLIGTLAVDRKPVPVPKAQKVKRSRAKTNMTRKEICANAAQFMLAKRHERRDRTRKAVYDLTIRPITAQEGADVLGVTKTYVRELLLEMIEEGKLKRRKFAGDDSYYYERV